MMAMIPGFFYQQAAAMGASGIPGAIDTGVSTHPVVSVIEHFNEYDGAECEVRVDWQEAGPCDEPAAILRIGSTGNGLVARQGPRGAELHIRGGAEMEAVRFALRQVLDALDDFDNTYVTTPDPAPAAPERNGSAGEKMSSVFDRWWEESRWKGGDSVTKASPEPRGSPVDSERYGSPSFPAAAF